MERRAETDTGCSGRHAVGMDWLMQMPGRHRDLQTGIVEVDSRAAVADRVSLGIESNGRLERTAAVEQFDDDSAAGSVVAVADMEAAEAFSLVPTC